MSLFLIDDSLAAQVKSKTFRVLLKTILSKNIPKITVPEAAQSFNKFVFIDAREWEEYRVSHILNALFVGYNDFDLSGISTMSKKTPLVVYCSIGKRSEAITKKLRTIGFTNVLNLYGGIFEWINQANPVFDNQGKQTDRVHAFNIFWGHWLDRGIKVY